MGDFRCFFRYQPVSCCFFWCIRRDILYHLNNCRLLLVITATNGKVRHMRKRTGYILQRGGDYYLRYRVGGKLFSRSLGTRDRQEAEQRQVEIMGPLQAADKVELYKAHVAMLEDAKTEQARLEKAAHPALAINQAWTAYLKSKNRPDTGKVTLSNYESEFKRLVNWLRVHYPQVTLLKDITPSIASEFMTHIGERFSHRTYNAYLTLFKHVFDILAVAAKIDDNPWDKKHLQHKKAKGHSVSRRELSRAEVAKLINTATGEMKLLFTIGAFTGMRLGDAVTLQWHHVNLDTGLIRYTPRKTQHTSGKTVKVGVPPLLAAMLQETPVEQRSGAILPELSATYDQCASIVTKRICAHFEDCGIKTTEKTNPKKRAHAIAGFHSFRHTFVSWNAELGTPQAIVRDMVGHGSVAMTAHYEHISDAVAIKYAGRLLLEDGTNNAASKSEELDVMPTKIKLMDNIIRRMTTGTLETDRKRLLDMLSW